MRELRKYSAELKAEAVKMIIKQGAEGDRPFPRRASGIVVFDENRRRASIFVIFDNVGRQVRENPCGRMRCSAKKSLATTYSPTVKRQYHRRGRA